MQSFRTLPLSWYLVSLTWSALVGAALSLFVLRNVTIAVFTAEVLTALATLVLAFFAAQSSAAARDSVEAARQSVEAMNESTNATRESVANENANYQLTNTVAIINQYYQTAIPVTNTISITTQSASSQLQMFAKKVAELEALKAQYDPASPAPADEQYRAIVSSVAVVINFFIVALQLLRRHLLDVPLFMNIFAKTFVGLIGSLRTRELRCKCSSYRPDRPPKSIE